MGLWFGLFGVGGGHLLSLPQHPLIHTDNGRTRASNQDGAAPRSHRDETARTLVWNNPPPHRTPGFASTHRSLSYAWVKSSQTPGLMLDLPPTSAGERESERTSEHGLEGEEEMSRSGSGSGSGRRAGGRASGRALLRQERLWIYDLNLAIYEVNATLKCMGIITGRLPR